MASIVCDCCAIKSLHIILANQISLVCNLFNQFILTACFAHLYNVVLTQHYRYHLIKSSYNYNYSFTLNYKLVITDYPFTNVCTII